MYLAYRLSMVKPGRMESIFSSTNYIRMAGSSFYLQWKYSADSHFLKEKAYPWVKEAARYFENISEKGKDEKRKLPLSSSPEINDNRPDAWFTETTNFDLACIRFTLQAAGEMADSLKLTNEAAHWKELLKEWPDFATDSTGLTIAPHYPLKYTHRHLSHLLAFHPLGLLDVSQGKNVKNSGALRSSF